VRFLKPYYERGGITIYHGDCHEILPQLETESVDLVLTDPPYGIGTTTNWHSSGRGCWGENQDWEPVVGDDRPFDPAFLLGFPTVILWGANCYAERLPSSRCWLVWDKRNGIRPDDNADCELAWTSLDKPARLYRHVWKGLLRGPEQGQPRFHPTQKALGLMKWCIELVGAELILDPFMGSGTTLRAAKDLGRRAIGIEIEERYCEIAVKRLAQEILL